MPLPYYPLDVATAHGVHTTLETLALCGGAAYYRLLRQRQGDGSILEGKGFALACGCLFGAGLGNKLMFWIEMPHLLPLYWHSPALLFGGQSMVGGLLGGLMGVELAKKISAIHTSTGDTFVFPILFGLMIGRVGCFLAGLHDGTYGNATTLPWGVDFGDGMARHPTQLYEIAFALCLWGLLRHYQAALMAVPGLSFRLLVCAYLMWRLFIDAFKPLPYDYLLHLSGIQLVCLLWLLGYGPRTLAMGRQIQFPYPVRSP